MVLLWLRLLCLPLFASALSTTAADDGVPTGIVILAQARSGSTLLGELFRQNEDILYFYEPCRALGQGLLDHYETLYREECFALARRLTRCEFTLQDSDRLSLDETAASFHSPAAASVRTMVRASEDGARKDALARAHEALVETCKTSRAVAVKTIRLLDGVGGDAAEYQTSGVRVLHLVRDPRAVVRSQLKMRGFRGFEKVLPNFKKLERMRDWRKRQRETRRAVGRYVCDIYRRQLQSPQHLDDDEEYLLVRYEDFALVPQVVADLVYRWSGLGRVPPSLAAWIDHNTRMENCSDPTRRQLLAAREAVGGGGGEGAALADDERGVVQGGERGGGGGGVVAAAVSPRTGNLRHKFRDVAAASPSAPDTESSAPRLLPPPTQRHDQLTPSGAAAVTADGAVAFEGPAPARRPDSPPARGGAAAAGGGRGGDDEDFFALERSHPRRTAAASRARCGNEAHADQHPFDTKRHSAQMADLWRKQMPAEDARAVWDACRDSNVMKELRYSA